MKYHFSKRMSAFKSSAVRDLLKLTQQNSIISFAGGLPAGELFPVHAIRTATEYIFQKGSEALQYGVTEGVLSLREKLVTWMKTKHNMEVGVNEVLVASGSQQIIDLFSRSMLDSRDVVLVESPTYLACLQTLHSYDAHIVSVESDDDGMIPEDLALKLKLFNPKFVYVVPTFSNPTGRVWSLERRQALLDLCSRHEVLILEDDPYGELRFTDAAVSSIASLEKKSKKRMVAYMSTFSKTIAPGLRTGWIVADKQIIRTLVHAKQVSDLHSSVLDQLIISELFCSEIFDFDTHIRNLSIIYKERMEAMKQHLQQHIWKGSVWSTPQGGMFFWVKLPEGFDAQALLKIAVDKGVAFIPGHCFYASTPEHHTMRLNFSFAHPDVIQIGMERLSNAMSEF